MSEFEVTKNNITNGKATASFIIGIISIVLAIIPIGGLILGIIGLILGIIGLQEIKNLKQKNRKIAVAGIVCCSIGILLSIIMFFGNLIIVLEA